MTGEEGRVLVTVMLVMMVQGVCVGVMVQAVMRWGCGWMCDGCDGVDGRIRNRVSVEERMLVEVEVKSVGV